MVVEFFEVVVGGFRWFYVVPCFSNYGLFVRECDYFLPCQYDSIVWFAGC